MLLVKSAEISLREKFVKLELFTLKWFLKVQLFVLVREKVETSGYKIQIIPSIPEMETRIQLDFGHSAMRQTTSVNFNTSNQITQVPQHEIK